MLIEAGFIDVYNSGFLLKGILVLFQTLLIDQKEVPHHGGQFEADLPEFDDRSQRSGSLKGGKLTHRHSKEKGKQTKKMIIIMSG